MTIGNLFKRIALININKSKRKNSLNFVKNFSIILIQKQLRFRPAFNWIFCTNLISKEIITYFLIFISLSTSNKLSRLKI